MFLKYQDLLQTHAGGIEEATLKFQSDMKTKRRLQTQVIAHCTKELAKAERDVEVEQRDRIAAYAKQEKHALQRLAGDKKLK